jgi:hypothetical protein
MSKEHLRNLKNKKLLIYVTIPHSRQTESPSNHSPHF